MINKLKSNKLVLFFLGAIILLMFLTMSYPDIIITYTHGINLLDCIKDGNLLGFYDYSLLHQYDSTGAVYYLTVYFIFAIWNLPIWILKLLFQIDIYHPLCLAWCKCMVVLFSAGCCYYMNQIMKLANFTKKVRAFALLFFVTSLNFIVPAIAVAQYDVISIFFTLWGIYYFMKHQKTDWKFLLIFSFAISLKIFAAFPFVLLLLLKEKNVIKIGLKGICGLILSVICVLPYHGNAGYVTLTETFNSGMGLRLVNAAIPGGNSSLPLFFACFTAICIWVYMQKTEEIYEIFRILMWSISAMFAAFSVFVFIHPQWIVLLMPFLELLILQNKKDFSVNLLLENVVNIVLTIYYGYIFSWDYFAPISFHNMFMRSVPGRPGMGCDSLAGIINALGLADYVPALYSIVAVCLGALLIINFSKKNLEPIEDGMVENMQWLFGFRGLCLVGYFAATAMITYII